MVNSQPMKTREAVHHFGSKASVAKALGISRAAVTRWGEHVPEGRAYQLELITGGALRAEWPDGNATAGGADGAHDAAAERGQAVAGETG